MAQATPTPRGDRRVAPLRSGPSVTHSEQEKAIRRTRVAAAKDALARSANLRGDHLVRARSDLKAYLRQLNQSPQPNDAAFAELLAAPFRVPYRRPDRR